MSVKHFVEYYDVQTSYYEIFSLGDGGVKERFYSLKYLSQILTETKKMTY